MRKIAMNIVFSILLNASILYIITILLNTTNAPDSVIVKPEGFEALKTYLLGGTILGLLNTFVKPVLKLLKIPLFFIYPIVSLLINVLILWLLSIIVNDIIKIDNMVFMINGVVNFIISVAIFVILNIVYSILFSK